AGIDVEELAGNGDYLPLERGAEERHPVCEMVGQPIEACPYIEAAFRRPVDRHPETPGAIEQELALGRESTLDGSSLGEDVLGLEQRCGGTLERTRSATVEERARAAHRLDHG